MTSHPRWWPLVPARKHYAWGSRTALPALLGEPSGPEPLAELWFGTHPDGPAHTPIASGSGTLGDRLAREGRPPSLGFMAKLLASAEPLSIQVHPGDKHESLVALGAFRLLCGFAPHDVAIARLDRAGCDGLARVLSRDGLAATLRTLTAWPADERSAACRRAARHDPLAGVLHARHPDDVGVIAGLLMNDVTLAAGDALALPSGTVHAYLEGLGLEAMTESDAVARFGLTRKPVDVEGFLAIANLEPGHVRPLAVAPDGTRHGAGNVRITTLHDQALTTVVGPAIVVSAGGIVHLDDIPLATGSGAFVPDGTAIVAAAAQGTAYAISRSTA